MSELTLVFASDIGGVVTTEDTDRAEPSKKRNIFGNDYLNAPEMPGAFDGLAEACDLTNGRAGLFSKCGPRIQLRTMDWLQHHNLTGRTGIPLAHVFFCLDRSGKAPLAVRHRTTAFADDRLEVLQYMPSVAHRYLFQPKPDEVKQHGPVPPDISIVWSWAELMTQIRSIL